MEASTPGQTSTDGLTQRDIWPPATLLRVTLTVYYPWRQGYPDARDNGCDALGGGCSVGVVHCSFCGRPAAEVSKLIAGPGVYICDDCVAKCNQILAGDTVSASPRLPEWDRMTSEEILLRLPRIGAVSAQVDASLRRLVTELHGRGVSWAQVGAALGITKQSAWERFTQGWPPDREDE